MHFSRKHFRQFWLNLHLAVALSVGLFFVILGLTGSCNVFYAELREWSLPKPEPSDNPQAPDLDHVLTTVKSLHSQRAGAWSLLLPGYGSDYLWVNYLKPEETKNELFAPLEILIDPYSGAIADQRFWGRSIPGLLYEIHADLILGMLDKEVGKIGFKIVCWLGVALFVSCLTGLYCWRPRNGKLKQALTIKPHASKERFYYDLHKTVGFYGSLFLLILAFTGFAFGYKDYLRPVVTLFSPVAEHHLKEPTLKSLRPAGSQQPLTIAQTLAIADRVFPNSELRMVKTPDGTDGIYMVAKKQPGEANRRRPRSKVWIDQYSGKVLAVQDPNRFTAGETFFNLMWPLHDGQAFGLPGRIVWCLGGFVPLLLYVTGILRWRQKRLAAIAKSLSRQRISMRH